MTRDELGATGGATVSNSVWDGSRVSLFGARNEVVAFNLVLEGRPDVSVKNVDVRLDSLTGPSGWADRPGHDKIYPELAAGL